MPQVLENAGCFVNIQSAEHQKFQFVFLFLLHAIKIAMVHLLFPKFSLNALWLLNSMFKTVPKAHQNKELFQVNARVNGMREVIF